MSDSIPAWLTAALKGARDRTGAGYGKLAVAKLASDGMLGKDGFAIKSAAFANDGALDPSFTADEEDAVAPPLEWSAPPRGTQELVLIVENPAGPGSNAKDDEPFCHWLVWGIAPQQGQLLEGETPPRQGKNSFGNSEWLLPDPPTGAPAQDYIFQLFALDLPLVLMPGADRDELLATMKGSVIAAALLTGTYAREEGGEYDWDDEDEDEGA